MTQRQGGWTSPQIIVAICSLAMAAGGTFMAMSKDTSNEARELDRRVTRIETSISESRQRRDEQIRDLSARIDRIEDRRR